MCDNVQKGLGDNIFVQRVFKFFQEVNLYAFLGETKIVLIWSRPMPRPPWGNTHVGMGVVSCCLTQRCAKLYGRLKRGLGLFETSLNVRFAIGLPKEIKGLQAMKP
jgi:hypothetical protein